jgi:hypothetical protein
LDLIFGRVLMQEGCLKMEISRLRMEDTKELHSFFRTVITDTFMKEGISEKLNDMKR